MIIVNNIECESFIVTGRMYGSLTRRFNKIFTGDRVGFMYAEMINLWNGSIWGITKEGKRKLIKRIQN